MRHVSTVALGQRASADTDARIPLHRAEPNCYTRGGFYSGIDKITDGDLDEWFQIHILRE